MVTIIPEEERKLLSYEEIKKTYAGKWVLLTGAELSPGNAPIKGIPTVVADRPYEGVRDGIYNEFDDIKYGQGVTMNLLPGPEMLSPLCEVMA